MSISNALDIALALYSVLIRIMSRFFARRQGVLTGSLTRREDCTDAASLAAGTTAIATGPTARTSTVREGSSATAGMPTVCATASQDITKSSH